MKVVTIRYNNDEKHEIIRRYCFDNKMSISDFYKNAIDKELERLNLLSEQKEKSKSKKK